MRLEQVISCIKKDKIKLFEEIIDFAKKQGYENIEYVDEWNGNSLYIATIIGFDEENDEIKEEDFLHILVENKAIRGLSSEEKIEIDNFLRARPFRPASPNVYLEEIIRLSKKYDVSFLEKIIEFAKEQGDKYVWSRGEWKGYDCFKISFTDLDNIDYIPITGYPSLILVKDKEIRMNTADESYAYIHGDRL